jgi:hypothetical protein
MIVTRAMTDAPSRFSSGDARAPGYSDADDKPWPFSETFAATWLDLQEKCAPPVIVWMPRGFHSFIRPLGSAAPFDWNVVSHIAAVANRQLEEMQAKAATGQGTSPFLDFNHSGTPVGEPVEFFWAGERGVCLLINWLGAAEQAIVSGQCDTFSPEWVRAGTDFLGLLPCVGALLSRSSQSAFGVRMPPLRPVSKSDALEVKAELFVRKIDKRVAASRNSGGPRMTALEAFEAVKSVRPELYTCYVLRNALRAEFAKNRLARRGWPVGVFPQIPEGCL